jgi:hypothetical protein
MSCRCLENHLLVINLRQSCIQLRTFVAVYLAGTRPEYIHFPQLYISGKAVYQLLHICSSRQRKPVIL